MSTKRKLDIGRPERFRDERSADSRPLKEGRRLTEPPLQPDFGGRRPPLQTAGFTLLELLASMAILGLMVVMLFSVFEQINKAWLTGENRVETFTDARAILDLMSRELSQAIATATISFHGDPNNVYFVAPVNTDPANQADLCEVGYSYEQTEVSGKWTMKITRHLVAPTPNNILNNNWNIYNATWWNNFTTGIGDTPATVATNSIVGLRFQYANAAGAWSGTWGTPNKLPYAIAIEITNVDSRTAVRMRQFTALTLPSSITNSTVRSFTTTVYMPNSLPWP